MVSAEKLKYLCSIGLISTPVLVSYLLFSKRKLLSVLSRYKVLMIKAVCIPHTAERVLLYLKKIFNINKIKNLLPNIDSTMINT